MSRDAEYWIAELGLAEHPEGGWYRETYRSERQIPEGEGAGRHPAGRCFSTAIYYLLRSGEASRLHRLASDELFLFHCGSSMNLDVIDSGGELERVSLGSRAHRGEVFQAAIRAGCWFGAEVAEPNSFSLVSCTVAPGFEFDDFEEGDRSRLVDLYPRHRSTIERLTRP